MIKLLTLLLCLFTALQSVAQAPLQFRLRHDVPVSTAEGTLPMPWSGGLNTPQFSTIDLNKDGQNDLFIFDRIIRKVYTYLAVQENGQWRYRYAPEYEVFFPDDLEHWVLLRDYNCDGLKDIFTSSPLGIRVFKQEPAPEGQLKFAVAENALFYRGRSGNNVNMQMNAADIPAIVDMDGDGDLDILLTEFSSGYTLEYYKNLQAEEGLACGTLKFVQDANKWGGIYEAEGDSCNDFTFDSNLRRNVQQSVMAPLHNAHEGSSLLTLDLNGNGVKDLLIGGVECRNLMMMENKGTATVARMDNFEPVFPLNTRPAQFNLFPAAYYEDVTFDGIPDLLVAPNSNESDQNVEMRRSVWLYRNNGLENNPNFNFVKQDFLQEEMLDLGEGAYPAFADLDGDGMLDLLVGNYASFRNGKYIATLSYFRNTGTATEPAFTLVTDDYLDMAAQELLAIKPAFADIDGNGVQDLILTFTRKQNNATHINYILNTAPANQPFQIEISRLQQLKAVTNGDSPCFADVDGDGDLDLLIGKTNGRLEFHRNTGSSQNPMYVLERQNLGGLDFNFSRRNLYPTVADIDGNGIPDLLIVDDSGVLHVYQDFTKDLTGMFEAKTELLENPLLKELQVTRFGRGLGIAVAPLAGKDKSKYIIIGSMGGGMHMLEQTGGNNEQPNESGTGLGLLLYPNPVDRVKQETVRAQAAEPVVLTVFDAVGRVVYKGGDAFSLTHTLPVHKLKAGIYLVRATSREGRHETRTLLVR